MLWFDPTETRDGTKLPPEFTAIGSPCDGLEGLTGADMLISPQDSPKITTVTTKMGQILLQKHLDAGAVLVQRKSGGDIINFIRDHDQILAKMQLHTRQAWLLTIGTYHHDANDKLCCNMCRLGGSDGWSYWSYWGALRAWQNRGGYVDNIPSEDLLVAWYERTLKQLQDKDTLHYAMPRKPSQQVVVDTDDSDDEVYQRNAAITALATIDSVGIAKAAAIADYTGCLAHALMFLSDPDNLSMAHKPSGIGSKIFANTARWLGLKTGGIGEDQWYERMIIDTVYPQKGEKNG